MKRFTFEKTVSFDVVADTLEQAQEKATEVGCKLAEAIDNLECQTDWPAVWCSLSGGEGEDQEPTNEEEHDGDEEE